MSSTSGLLKGAAASVVARFVGVQVVGTVEAREEGCIRRNGLTLRCYMSCKCNSGVMRSGLEALGSQVDGEGSGLGGLESLGSQPLNGLGSLKRGGRELGAVRPIYLKDSGVGRKGKVGEDFGPNKLGLVGETLLLTQRLQKGCFLLGLKREPRWREKERSEGSMSSMGI